MGQLVILGTSNSVPDQEHGNTHMLIREGKSVVLVDCAGDVIQRLQRINLNFNDLTDIIVTHFHPDHVSGVPILLMGLWILGRKHSLNILGNSFTIDRIKATMDFYEWQNWPEFYPVNFISIDEKENATVIETSDLIINASTVKHFIPTIGLRVEFPLTGKSFAYSCDTEPFPSVERLAKNVDVLLHEATGAMTGHSSPCQAAEIANKAQAKSLYLIHYQARGKEMHKMLTEAQNIFHGPVMLSQDFMTLDFD